MKKIIISVLLCILMHTSYAFAFTDVASDSPCKPAINYLSEEGIFTGYDDDSFRPLNNITRAEVAAVICRSAGINPDSASSIYSDVPDSHWAKGYIMAATKAGIINGSGRGKFNPNDYVTYNEVIKMIVCMIAPDENFSKPSGHWVEPYLNYACDLRMMTYDTRYNMLTYGDEPVNRQNAAQFLHNGLMFLHKDSARLGGNYISIGMSASLLPYPDEILPSIAGFDWYVYGTSTYQDFYAVGVKDSKVFAFASSGLGFNYNGISYGTTHFSTMPDTVYYDGKNNSTVHGIFILSDENYYNYSNPTAAQLAGESKMSFHLTNGIRAAHGLKLYTWNDAVATAARLHSENMAVNDVYGNPEYTSEYVGTRLSRQGISYVDCGENMSMGTVYVFSFTAYNAFLSSSNTRSQLLGNFDVMGVGGAYNKESMSEFYYTHDVARLK